ncbi:MAG: CvpA family protein [Lachnospiraceae bacterium]|nr:CvpA family protein [Lachnospiraceae bacterium]
MGNIVLAGVVIFLILTTLIGYSQGLVKMLFSLVSVILILGLVTVLTPIVKDYVRGSDIEKNIKHNVEQYVDKALESSIEAGGSIVNIGKQQQKKAIYDLPLPESMKAKIVANNNEEGYKNFDVDNFSDYLVAYITDTVIDTGIFICLIITLSILVNMAIMLLNIFSKLPIINTFNRGGGAIIGFVEGLLIVWVICIVITAFSTTEWGQKLFDEINNNVLLDMIYSHNYLEKLLDLFF